MIDYLARQNSDALVVGWALSMMLLAFAAIALAGIAMWTGSVLAAVLTVALLVVFWVPTVLLILVSKKQETWSKGARLWGEADD
jgi:hypothetical protein